MEKEENKKSVWESKILSSKIKSGNVTLIPEALFGYLGGPFFALVPNAIINAYLTQYWKNVLGLADWASAFTWLLPLLSAILIVVGNLIVYFVNRNKDRHHDAVPAKHIFGVKA